VKKISALMAVALVAAACSSPTGTDRAPSYFEALRPAARDFTRAIAEVGRVFDVANESVAIRTTRLTDLRVGSDLAIAEDRARRLEPASVYQADHDRYLATMAEVRDLYRGFDEAVATGDTARAAVAAVGMEAAAGLGFSGLSAEYCGWVTFDMRLCNRPLGPTEYEAVLYTVMLDLTAGYAPLMRTAPLALDSAEALEYLTVIDPAAVERLERVGGMLESADPPPDRLADHLVLVAMLDAVAEIHLAGGDHADLPPIFCDASAGLSTVTADLSAIFFRDDDLGCET